MRLYCFNAEFSGVLKGEPTVAAPDVAHRLGTIAFGNRGIPTNTKKQADSTVQLFRFEGERDFDDIVATLKSAEGWPGMAVIELVQGASVTQ